MLNYITPVMFTDPSGAILLITIIYTVIALAVGVALVYGIYELSKTLSKRSHELTYDDSEKFLNDIPLRARDDALKRRNKIEVSEYTNSVYTIYSNMDVSTEWEDWIIDYGLSNINNLDYQSELFATLDSINEISSDTDYNLAIKEIKLAALGYEWDDEQINEAITLYQTYYLYYLEVNND